MAREVARTIEAVWRIESGRIMGGVARLVRDVGLAEDLAQEALIAALEKWPGAGVPENPGAWLMTVAKNKALDNLRLQALQARKHDELCADADARGATTSSPTLSTRWTRHAPTTSATTCCG